jgi:hypothetical protein
VGGRNELGLLLGENPNFKVRYEGSVSHFGLIFKVRYDESFAGNFGIFKVRYGGFVGRLG